VLQDFTRPAGTEFALTDRGGGTFGGELGWISV
jgi:hypothetical protein